MSRIPNLLLALSAFLLPVLPTKARPTERPNVLFIAIDDLNHWLGHLGRNPQAKTPNIDRLAGMGVSFTSAYCAVPACEPSRLALMGGRRPWTTGAYLNGDRWKTFQMPGEGLAAQFLKADYYVAGAGKIYHGIGDHLPAEWTEYMNPKGLSANGPGVSKYDGYFEPHDHDLKDEDLTDWHSADYCIERLGRKHDKPFFLACGLYKPHLAFVAPRKYYEDFPLEDIELPPHLENDLDDIPEAGRKMNSKDHEKMVKNETWKLAIQSYLATCAYTDMNVGRLLDALEAGPNRDNTIIVLWSDHGWSFGEKEHWRKFALWEEPTRTALIWAVPGVTPAGERCDRPVDLMSIYPTLCDLAGLPRPDHLEGMSILPLLKDPKAEWSEPAITTHGYRNHALRLDHWRLIQYRDGSQELYDHREDPYEYVNLASDPGYAETLARLEALLPKSNAKHQKGGAK
ncbi:MAG: sulfatase [Verrucomicrobiales bacterium]|nr:sulfatase [Verrucomicrobiales bacterium]